MTVKLQATRGRSATRHRVGWFSAALGMALFASSPGAHSADAGPRVVAAAADWDGFYVGASAGGVGLGNTARLNAVPSREVFGLFGPLTEAQLDSLSTTLVSDAGALGGAHVGFNHRVGRFVLGAEADFSLTSMRSQSDASNRVTTEFCSGTPTPVCLPAAFRYDVNSSHELPWIATARARFGYLATERMLVYATGGLALGGVRTKLTTVLAPAGGLLPDDITARYSGARRDTRVGAAVGGGLEYAFTNRISIRAEYLYVHLGDRSSAIEPDRDLHDVIPLPANSDSQASVDASLSPPSVPGASVDMRDESQFHSLRIGINLHF